MADDKKDKYLHFGLRLDKEEDEEFQKLAKRLDIDLRGMGAKKKTIMASVKLANKRLEDIENKALSFTDEERAYLVKCWGLNMLQPKKRRGKVHE